MWDWSNQPIQKKTPAHGSLTSVYEEISLSRPSQSPAFYRPNTNIENYTLEEMRHYLQPVLAQYGLHKMKLILKDYTSQSWKEMRSAFSDYQRARKNFLKLIAYSETANLIKLGLNNCEIALLKEGVTPENFNTHIKIPFDFGGSLDFENFSFIRTHHTHSNIHRVLDMQITNGFFLKHQKIFVPAFEGKFYYD